MTFPFSGIPIPIQSKSKDEFHRMLLLGQNIEDGELGPAVKEKEEVLQQYIDVRPMFPRWIRERSEKNPPTNYIVKFTQSYYDWLYNLSG